MFADSKGAKIGFDVTGRGEPVVLIGGVGAGRRYWDRMVPLLEGFQVITLDNRGVGETEYSGQFSMDDMGDDVIAVLDALDYTNAHIVGWSMGAHIARNVACRYPERVTDLSLVATYLDRPARSQYVLDGMASLVESGRAPMEVLYRSINAFCLTEATFRKFEKEGREVPLPRESVDPAGFMMQLRAIDANDRRAADVDITAPTLLIHGDEDIMVPWAEGRRVADLIPSSQWVLLEGEGHGIAFESYAAILRSFMLEHPCRSLLHHFGTCGLDLLGDVPADHARAGPAVVHVGDQLQDVGVGVHEREVHPAHEHRHRVGEVVAYLRAVLPDGAAVVLPEEGAGVRLLEEEPAVVGLHQVVGEEHRQRYPRRAGDAVDLLRPHDDVGLVAAPPAHLAGEVLPVRHADVVRQVQVVLHLGADASQPLEDVLPAVYRHHIAPTKTASPTTNPMTPRMSPTPLRTVQTLSAARILATLIEYPPRTSASAPKRIATAPAPLMNAQTAPTIPRTQVRMAKCSGLRFFSGTYGMSTLQSHSSQKSASSGFSCPHLGHFCMGEPYDCLVHKTRPLDPVQSDDPALDLIGSGLRVIGTRPADRTMAVIVPRDGGDAPGFAK